MGGLSKLLLLEELDLSATRVRGDVKNLAINSKLRKLYLADTNVDGEVWSLSCLVHLKELHLDRTNVNHLEVESFEKMLNRLEIEASDDIPQGGQGTDDDPEQGQAKPEEKVTASMMKEGATKVTSNNTPPHSLGIDKARQGEKKLNKGAKVMSGLPRAASRPVPTEKARPSENMDNGTTDSRRPSPQSLGHPGLPPPPSSSELELTSKDSSTESLSQLESHMKTPDVTLV